MPLRILAFSLFALLSSRAAFAAYPVTLVATWGSFGSGDGQFSDPVDVAVAPTGEVYVIEDDNGRVQEFSPTGTFIRKWGRVGAAQGEFSSPTGIAIGSDGSVYTTETGRSRCQRFTPEGAYLASFAQQGSGSFLEDVAADGTGKLAIAVAGNFSSINIYTLDGTYVRSASGTPIPFWPVAVCTDGAGNILAGQSQNVVRFSEAAGTYLGYWNPAGATPVTTGITTDGLGHVFSADLNGNRVIVSDALGTFLGDFGVSGSGPGEFNHPYGIAVSPLDGRIFVVDRGNHRVEVWAPNPTPAQARSWGRIKADYR
jgi:DNA-binding beta-propeller fold protein YncE